MNKDALKEKKRRSNDTPSNGTPESPSFFSYTLSLIGDNWNLILAGTLTLIGIAMLSLIGGPSMGFVWGQPAPESYRTPVDFEYVDLSATRELKQERKYQAPLVFRDDSDKFQADAERLKKGIMEGNVEFIQQNTPLTSDEAGDFLSVIHPHSKSISEIINAMREMVVVSDLDWGEYAPRVPDSIILRGGGENSEKVIDADHIVVLSPDCDKFIELLSPLTTQLEPEKAGPIAHVMAELLSPTARLDLHSSQRVAQKAGEVEPVVETFTRGDLLIREGEIVGLEEVRRLRAAHRTHFSQQRGVSFLLQRLAGLILIFSFFTWVLFHFIIKFSSENRVKRSLFQCLSLVTIVLLTLVIARICIFYALPLYLVPFTALVMTLALIVGQKPAFLLSAFMPATLSMLTGYVGVEYPVFMIGGMTAVLIIGRVRTREHLLRIGLVTGVVQASVLFGFALVNPETSNWNIVNFWQSPIVFSTLLAFCNGLFSGLIVTAALPAIEKIFQVTTDIRLLEWSDPNQPLLQRLLLEAPGTYHHSMIVGSLAADAAEAVGANPLLTRVSAYFHDVGKLKKPEYFSENQQNGTPNPHDELAPTMSRLIITAHPRDGAEMAADGGLPPAVNDIILQSHGTTATSFFWSRAKDQTSQEDTPPDKDTFRYKLPEPKSKEAACVMLADAAESATRSLDEPGTGKIEEVVKSIVLDRLHDGQLDYSGLTIPDIAKLQKALIRGLNAVFHKRVKYPGKKVNAEK